MKELKDFSLEDIVHIYKEKIKILEFLGENGFSLENIGNHSISQNQYYTVSDNDNYLLRNIIIRFDEESINSIFGEIHFPQLNLKHIGFTASCLTNFVEILNREQAIPCLAALPQAEGPLLYGNRKLL